MLPASIYIREDFGASYFPDANGNFGMMSTAAPETHIQVEGDFRENPEIYFMSPNRQLQTPSFGAFRRNNLPPSSANDTRRRSPGNAVYSLKNVQTKMANRKIGKERIYAKNLKNSQRFLQLRMRKISVFMLNAF